MRTNENSGGSGNGYSVWTRVVYTGGRIVRLWRQSGNDKDRKVGWRLWRAELSSLNGWVRKHVRRSRFGVDKGLNSSVRDMLV